MWIINKFQTARFTILLFLISCGLWPVACGLLYAQNSKVRVPVDLTTSTFILNLMSSATPVEGRIYYDFEDKKCYYSDDGLTWKAFSQDKNVATKIVSAKNSILTSDETADYNCDGTLTTGGDEVEINQAINAVASRGGGVVYLLEGNFWISNPIVVPSNVAIIGTGTGTVISPKSYASINNNGLIINSDSSAGNGYILLQNFKIDGNKALNNTTQYGIYFNKVFYSKIDRLWIENTRDNGIYLLASVNNIISGNNIQLNRTTAIFFLGTNNIISGNNVQQNGSGIYIWGSGNSICGNNIQSNQTFGINLFASSNSISSNNVQQNGGAGITMLGSANTISNNSILGNGQQGIYCSSLSSYNIFSGNSIRSNNRDGICLYNSSNNTILDNVIYDNGGSATSYDGIKISYNSDDNTISSNFLFDSSGDSFPINIGYGDDASNISENNYLVGNQINWSVTCADCKRINDTATNTRHTDKTKLTLGTGSSYILSLDGVTITPSEPTSYLRLVPAKNILLSSSKSIADGKAIGDWLVLENTCDLYTIRVYDNANTQLYMGQFRDLNPKDTLSLIWDGIDWIETGYAENNSP